MNAVSAIILGHSHDYVDNAVKEQIDKGSIHTVNSALELDLADLLIEEIQALKWSVTQRWRRFMCFSCQNSQRYYR